MNIFKLVIILLVSAPIGVFAGMSEDFSNIFTVNTLSNSLSPDESSALPNTMQILCAPNPFNSQAAVSIYSPQSGAARIDLYNLEGKIVITIYQGYLSKGWTNLTLNAAKFTSGIYFIRIEMGNINSVRKVVLIR